MHEAVLNLAVCVTTVAGSAVPDIAPHIGVSGIGGGRRMAVCADKCLRHTKVRVAVVARKLVGTSKREGMIKDCAEPGLRGMAILTVRAVACRGVIG